MLIFKPQEVKDIEKQNDVIVVNYNSTNDIIMKILDWFKVERFEIKKAKEDEIITKLMDFTFLFYSGNSFEYRQAPYFILKLINLLKEIDRDSSQVVPLHKIKLPEDKRTIIYYDCETSGSTKKAPLDPKKNKIELIQMNINGEEILSTPRDSTKEQFKEFFKELVKHPIVGHNLMFDISTWYDKTGYLPDEIYDTMYGDVLERITNKEGRLYHSVLKGSSLLDVTERYCKVILDKSAQMSDWGGVWTTKQLNYAKNDVRYLPEIMEKQIKKLNKLSSSDREVNIFGLKNLVARLEMKVLLVLIPLRCRGINVNYNMIIKKLKEAYENEIKQLEVLKSLLPEVENFNSRDQVMAALQNKGIKLPDFKKGTLKQYSDKKLINEILKHKEYSQVGKNLTKYKKEVIYPEWTLIGSPPGRMATKKPSVQNIPRDIKDTFYDPRYNLIRADYPAIELRICAWYIKDEKLIETFNNDIDAHKKTASLVLNKPIDKITKSERQLAKAINYGLIYGMGYETFKHNADTSYGVKMTLEEAIKYKTAFYKAYPKIEQWHNETGYKINSGGIVVSTLFGRKMFYGKKEYTEALNGPIQGSGADMLKLALVSLEKRLREYSCKIVNIIHDEIIVAVEDQKDVERASKDLKETMEKSANLLMPGIKTPVDVEVSLSSDPEEIEEEIIEYHKNQSEKNKPLNLFNNK